MTTQLLLANTVPQNPADSAYVTQLNALKSALRNGRQVRASMTYSDGAEYFTELVAGYFRSDRINVVLPLQNYQDNENVVTRLNGLFSECINTLGTYYWCGSCSPTSTSGLWMRFTFSNTVLAAECGSSGG